MSEQRKNDCHRCSAADKEILRLKQINASNEDRAKTYKRNLLNACKQRDELLSAQKSDAAFVNLQDLVEALDSTVWSSWQTTEKFDVELTRAREFIANVKGGA